MKDICVTKIDYKYRDIYKTFFKSIEKINKHFILTEKDQIYLINNGHIDIGIIVINESDQNLNLTIYQPPNICRLSILSLIEISAILSKKIDHDFSFVVFKLLNATSYNFKFKLIFSSFEEQDESIKVSSDLIKNTKEEQITFRNITFLDF